MRNIKSLKTTLDEQLARAANQISIIELVDLIVEFAYVSRASDIHLEPADDKVMARLRIDGILHDAFFFAKELQDEVVSRIKVLSGLKTDIHHSPQDGRFKAKMEGGREIDIRVSIAPTYYGENVVMRILAEAAQIFTLDDLGFSKDQLAAVHKAILKPYGMILANGPTGSGKSTTLYAMIKKLNTKEVSIITVEDPIEYSIPGITQMQVNVQAGLTFASGLRSILRQDPNIIMVGEIRDSETANIAVNAALTGHLMLSTLHTNDAATTFPRLIDMGVPPFLVASTVNVVIAQRLVRVVCPSCRKARTLSIAELKSLSSIAKELLVDKVYTVGPGCNDCDHTGYKSRIGIHEVLEINDDIRSLIVGRADANQIKQQAVKNGMKTMIEDGVLKAHAGVTTIEEILRIIYE
ncbi:MAG: Type IV-A pilus assembly ATPase PilB [Candidatus Jorgensenbacteria bacterium GW2011_GWA1_48_11]|uniref:Type IV-A pilus assembly ATPase PilB n=1 Tax=Candidatus Jorgensenbacteria bacterium GW2011_GWA1_48_11 TaxID=1618660 RepID=A0A0G1UAZ9_9BACT|nr:MAG: Type IV-A pilus assembly ATPase PilB [Candidatus Jorgensenbacteria bacterium GW2011_GWA1_48_11]KKW12720.1 MAG: Type IV-A pilus assembly ATPase PilB [Candidatus Jorgensenbacteria bacterium GW2011_GWB1_49_9]